MSRRKVLLVHGVNSTGEWYKTTTAEFRGIFDCVPIQYRYYHGLAGPFKVYVWPTAVMLMAPFLAWRLTERDDIRLGVAVATLIVNSLLVATAEFDWSGRSRLLAVPLGGLLAGTAAANFLTGDLRYAVIIAAIAAISAFLELREYSNIKPSDRLSCLVAFLTLVIGTIVAYFVLTSTSDLTILATLALLAVAAIVEPGMRQRLAFKFVRQRLTDFSNSELPPHVVAHSLGTYLVGHLLHENDHLNLARILFTGCVLDRSFPWDRINRKARIGCWGVLNCCGSGDVVPILTGLLRCTWIAMTWPVRWPLPLLSWLPQFITARGWRPLGWAGQRGFYDDSTIVHSLQRFCLCSDCDSKPMSALVHNVQFPFAGHSTQNQLRNYQHTQWLPFLLGSDAAEFDLWLRFCLMGAAAARALEDAMAPGSDRALRRRHEVDLRDIETALLAAVWYWPLITNPLLPRQTRRGKTLRESVQTVLNAPGPSSAIDGPNIDTLMARIPRILFANVRLALDARLVEDSPAEIVEQLEPRCALIAAIELAIAMGP